MGVFTLYVSYFPQIISGPIERFKDFSCHITSSKHEFDVDQLSYGFSQFLVGIFQKVVLADRLGLLVDTVFKDVSVYGGLEIWLAVFAYTLQIYFDFSGYSDMAIGISNMFGISTRSNFDRPYFALSIGEFWRRWHITLSTWFRDYVYIPLGGSRCTDARWCLNILIVFLLSGMWHGSELTFVIFGGVHGLYQILERIISKANKKQEENISILYRLSKRIITFFLVGFAWMFFRADNLIDVKNMLSKMFVLHNQKYWIDILKLGMGKQDLILVVILLIVWFVLESKLSKTEFLDKIRTFAFPVKWSIYLVLIFTCILFGVYGDLSEASYVYFQF